MNIRDKVSKFLFPIKSRKTEDGKTEFYLTIRFGIFSILLWDLYCRIFGNG